MLYNIINKNNFLKTLLNDVLGGVTSGIVAIPLALAFGVASGLGPLAGLYGAIILCFFAAIFGGAKTQISGPTGPMTVVLASTVALYPSNPEIVFFIIILAGFFQILISFLKIASIVKYVPYPVISGFLSGIGVIIIILQLNPLLGAKVIGSPVKTLLSFPETYNHFNIESVILGLITLLIVFLTPKTISKIVPTPLIALVSVTLFSMAMGFQVDVIGEIATKLPDIAVSTFNWHNIKEYIPIALTLAIIGAVDSLLTALVIDSLTKEKHSPDKVLFGQGIGNAITGLFGGVIGAGATMRTVVNIKAGGTGKSSAIIHALFLSALLIGAAPLIKNVPLAVLAGILIKVAYEIIDVKFLKVINFAPKHDLVVMLIVFVLTVFDDLIFAVGVGVTLSALLFAKQATEKTRINVKNVYDAEIMKIESQIEHDSHHKIRIVHIDGVFFFGSVTQIVARVDELLGTKYLILNFESIPLLDISAIFALEDIIIKLKSQNIKVMIVLNCPELENQLQSLGIIGEVVTPVHVFYDEVEAINKAKRYLKIKATKS